MTDTNTEAIAQQLGRDLLRLSWITFLSAPHRFVLGALAAGLMTTVALILRWDWVPSYAGAIAEGVGVSMLLLASSATLGFFLAVPVGLAQVFPRGPLAMAARTFCTVIRGTPLLLQLWLLYYGLGSLFPAIPGIRTSFIWPYLREAWPYALVALTTSFVANEGEVMRGALAGVPRGELEAARALGMSRFATLWTVWLPLAMSRALPTLAGETVLQLKSTPLVATVTVTDAYAVFSRIRQDTYLTYEPLLLLALIYIILTGLLLMAFRVIDRRFVRPRA